MNLRTAPEMLKVSPFVFVNLPRGPRGVVSYINFLLLTSDNLFSSVYDKHDNPLTSEEEEQRAIAKIKMLGNIKFIGELGKLDLIHESILHKCIKTVWIYFFKLCLIILSFNSGVLICKINQNIDPLHIP